MTDPVNERYGITDAAIAAELAIRRSRNIEAKASAAIADMLPTVQTEAMFGAFDVLAWDGERRGRWIDQAALNGTLPGPA